MSEILLVDDDSVLLCCIAELLERYGHRVIARSKAEVALAEVAAGAQVDLVITDYRMGGMNGVEFLHAVRQLRPDVPAVVLTGHGTLDLYLLAKGLGAVEFIQKPFKVRDLLRTIDAVLYAQAEVSR